MLETTRPVLAQGLTRLALFQILDQVNFANILNSADCVWISHHLPFLCVNQYLARVVGGAFVGTHRITTIAFNVGMEDAAQSWSAGGVAVSDPVLIDEGGVSRGSAEFFNGGGKIMSQVVLSKDDEAFTWAVSGTRIRMNVSFLTMTLPSQETILGKAAEMSLAHIVTLLNTVQCFERICTADFL